MGDGRWYKTVNAMSVKARSEETAEVAEGAESRRGRELWGLNAQCLKEPGPNGEDRESGRERNRRGASRVVSGVDDGATISMTMTRMCDIAASDPVQERVGAPSVSVTDERELIERARGDRRAFAPLYLAHYPAIVSHIHRRIGDAHAAQDIAAETFIRAMNGIGRFQQRGLAFRHWLLRIASNEINRHLHRVSRRRMHERGAAKPHGDAANVRESEGVERAERVQAALLALTTDHQTVIALHYFEGLSVEEVARVLGCRAGTVKSRLGRARAALAGVLGDGSEGLS